jgi:hypothetical protein
MAVALPDILIAQNCDFAKTGVRYNYSNTDGNGNCIINIDLYFDLRTNSGSKYMALHIWPTAFYPNLPYNNPPISTNLVNSTTIVIHHFQEHLELHSVYNPDTQVQPQYLDMLVTLGPSETAGYDRFTISNINLTVPGGCSTPQSFTVDMWSTESQSMNQVMCFDKGTVFYANNPRVIALLNCNLPRTYNVQIFSIDPAPMTVDYKVFVDDGDNVFNKITDTLMIHSETGRVISENSSYNSGYLGYLPYSNLAPWANMNLWVEVTSASLPNSVIALIENSCSALPVKWVSFTAKPAGQMILLNWITAGEFMNKGFYVERKIGDGTWTSLGFVNSLATKGTTNLELIYTYTDNVVNKGIFQYRIKQVDLNGNVDYSVVRVVRIDIAEIITIFPNPSAGTVNIVFPEKPDQYKVSVYSTEGKKIGEWQNNSSILTINNLKSGVYFIKVYSAQRVINTYKLIVQ